jgi:hypothetical protein
MNTFTKICDGRQIIYFGKKRRNNAEGVEERFRNFIN